MPWLYVHIPRTGGSTIREQIGTGISDTRAEHLPVSAYLNRPTDTVVCSVVRNPYDRAVSLAAIAPGSGSRQRTMAIEFFERWVRDGFRHQVMNLNTGHALEVSAPMVAFITYRDADFIGRFEEYQTALDRIGGIVGKTLENKLTGNTAHLPWWEYYRDDLVRELVAAKYAADFVEFGYSTTITEECRP